MAETLLLLIAAHVLADFVLQPRKILDNKHRVWVLLIHILIVTAVAYLFLGVFHWQILAGVFVTHLLMDAIKVYLLSDALAPFLIDQFVHIVALIGLAWYFPEVAWQGWWATRLEPELLAWYFASLSLMSGFILCVPAGGFMIAKAIKRFTDEIGSDGIRGLKSGGQYIGWLERSLVMLFVLIGQPTGIGFLIAAKSILRFGEIKEPSQRKVAEYIIIGTFMSFGWALLAAFLTKTAIALWLPN